MAVTKLRAPTMSEVVVGRPRIAALLDGAIDSSRSLALVSAPAGAGKSTALATWLEGRRDLKSVWFQIDGADNDPIRFWSGLVTALAHARPGIDQKVLPVLRAPNTSFEVEALPVLVNALDDVTARLVVVLDDYHLITNPEIHDAMQNLIDALPEVVTLAVSARIDPPLRLGRLRVRGQLTEIRAHDLRFNSTEAACFFIGDALEVDEIDALCARTEGWAAGLALAAASLARGADSASFVKNFAGDNRLVVDYLATELWDGLPAPAKELMLATSILDEMCGPLVNTVAGIDDGMQWLEESARQNQLLISLDEHCHWYRYHHLLRDLLRDELQRTNPSRIPELHRRAAAWFSAEGLHEDAIRHSFAANDLMAAADLVGSAGLEIVNDGNLRIVQGWLDQLGPGRVEEHLGCAVVQGWVLVITGRFEELGRWLQTSRRLLAESPAAADTPRVGESIAAVTALAALAEGDIGAALAAAESLAADTENHDLASSVADLVGGCRTLAGHFGEARSLLETAAGTAPSEGQHLIACTSRRDLAVLAIENGDLGRAHHYAKQALDYAEAHHLGAYYHLAQAHSVVAVTTFIQDRGEALRHAERAVELARRSNRPIALAYTLATRAQIASLDHRNDAARIDLVEARKLLDRCPDPGMVLTFVARREAHLGGSTGQPTSRIGSAVVEELTERELTVLRLLPSRLTAREIADELYVSHNTVKGHVKAIYRKLGVSDRALAIQRARELRLL